MTCAIGNLLKSLPDNGLGGAPLRIFTQQIWVRYMIDYAYCFEAGQAKSDIAWLDDLCNREFTENITRYWLQLRVGKLCKNLELISTVV